MIRGRSLILLQKIIIKFLIYQSSKLAPVLAISPICLGSQVSCGK